VQALLAYSVGMSKIQYTIRNIPEHLDSLLRKETGKSSKSLNTVLLEALSRGMDVTGTAPVYNDLDSLAGSWVEDPEFDEAVAGFDEIDKELWK